MIFEAKPEEYNNTCFIVGGGPSLKGFDWSKLNGKFVIAINRSYEVLPKAQIVYFTDRDYWQRHKDAMLKHSGQLMRGALKPEKEEQHPDLIFYELTGKTGIDTNEGCLKHGSNSTYAAINLAAVHLKFKQIYLLGVDMKWKHSSAGKPETHWHNGHKRVDVEKTYKGFMAAYETIKEPLKKLGVNVFNVNTPEGTDLKAFPIVSPEQVFGLSSALDISV